MFLARREARNFQYPPSDRAHCNFWSRGAYCRSISTFSILHRIEPTVTSVANLCAYTARVFQYPPSDRAHCNTAPQNTRLRLTTYFQYPPSDRAHCNDEPGKDRQSICKAFSILHRIEPTVTDTPRIDLVRLQNFQYPPSDRAHCNCLHDTIIST